MTRSLSRRAALTGKLTRALLLSLLALLCVWFLWLAPPEKARPWVILLIHLIPLAGFLPAVLAGRPRPHAWLCFVLLIYFCEGVIFATSADSTLRWLGMAEAVNTALLFTSAMFFARWQSRWLKSERRPTGAG